MLGCKGLTWQALQHKQFGVKGFILEIVVVCSLALCKNCWGLQNWSSIYNKHTTFTVDTSKGKVLKKAFYCDCL